MYKHSKDGVCNGWSKDRHCIRIGYMQAMEVMWKIIEEQEFRGFKEGDTLKARKDLIEKMAKDLKVINTDTSNTSYNETAEAGELSDIKGRPFFIISGNTGPIGCFLMAATNFCH
uniref:Uncharacterized protein n=1 Tax=Glossina palpalis gambiensis TaxID=67801 RepID=A0A1B0BTA8_9MUSC